MVEYETSYFEGEYRNDFYIEPMMKRAWAAQVEVLCEVAKICSKYNIQYFADWGTLLGTVRHSGFIPWDDDLDIGMRREDYQRFLSVAKKELPEGFDLLNAYTNPEYPFMITRVVNEHRIRTDEEHLKKFHGFPFVAGIDIFPIDYIPRNKEDEQLQCQLIKMVSSLSSALTLENPTDPDLQSAIETVQQLCGVKFHNELPIKIQLVRLWDQLCALYTAEESDELASISDLANGWNYHVKKSSYAESIMMPFEHIMMPVPVGYDEILKVKYGENYMTPVRRNSSHAYPFYKKQIEDLKQRGLDGVIKSIPGIEE